LTRSSRWLRGQDRPRRRADPHPGEQQLYFGTELLERGCQQQVLLEALAATPVVDELSLESLVLQLDWNAPVRI
jgi:hypothetical protein